MLPDHGTTNMSKYERPLLPTVPVNGQSLPIPIRFFWGSSNFQAFLNK